MWAPRTHSTRLSAHASGRHFTCCPGNMDAAQAVCMIAAGAFHALRRGGAASAESHRRRAIIAVGDGARLQALRAGTAGNQRKNRLCPGAAPDCKPSTAGRCSQALLTHVRKGAAWKIGVMLQVRHQVASHRSKPGSWEWCHHAGDARGKSAQGHRKHWLQCRPTQRSCSGK